MRHVEHVVGLDLEDLTPRQLRHLLRMSARRGIVRDQKDEDDDKEADKAAEDNDDVVSLQEEKKGKSQAPKVAADDLPEGVEIEKPKKRGKA